MGFFGGGGSGGGYPPVTSNTGAVQVGFSGGDALGTDAINIQPNRSATNQVAADADSIVIGKNARAKGFSAGRAQGSVVIGSGASAASLSADFSAQKSVVIGNASISTRESSVAIGDGAQASNEYTIGIGISALASGDSSIVLGRSQSASGKQGISIGVNTNASQTNSIVLGSSFDTLENVTCNNYGEFSTHTFKAYFWKGTTTNATETEIFLFGNTSGSSRAVISANSLALIDLYITANSTGAGKALISRRFVGIRRDNSNNTSLVGTVQTIGSDQNTGSPTWSVAITADDTNESLKIAVTGAASETVAWKVLGFVRLV